MAFLRYWPKYPIGHTRRVQCYLVRQKHAQPRHRCEETMPTIWRLPPAFLSALHVHHHCRIHVNGQIVPLFHDEGVHPHVQQIYAISSGGQCKHVFGDGLHGEKALSVSGGGKWGLTRRRLASNVCALKTILWQNTKSDTTRVRRVVRQGMGDESYPACACCARAGKDIVSRLCCPNLKVHQARAYLMVRRPYIIYI